MNCSAPLNSQSFSDPISLHADRNTEFDDALTETLYLYPSSISVGSDGRGGGDFHHWSSFVSMLKIVHQTLFPITEVNIVSNVQRRKGAIRSNELRFV